MLVENTNMGGNRFYDNEYNFVFMLFCRRILHSIRIASFFRPCWCLAKRHQQLSPVGMLVENTNMGVNRFYDNEYSFVFMLFCRRILHSIRIASIFFMFIFLGVKNFSMTLCFGMVWGF